MRYTLKKAMREKRKFDLVPLFMALFIILLYALIHTLLGTDPFRASSYNSYTLQAMAWRNGQVSLGRDYPHLELAIFNNDWYVSFPPVPSVPLYLLSFVFGMNTPDGFLVKMYVAAACYIIYFALKKRGFKPWASALFALFLCFANCLFALTFDGGVWYQAQTLAFLCAVAACALFLSDHPTWGCILFALAVGCRPFDVCFGPVLILIWFLQRKKSGMEIKKIIRRLVPGLLCGLAIAGVYMWYNYIRFGNPLEFGHNYLPEFSTQGGVQFSLSHVASNVKTFLFGSPLQKNTAGEWTVNKFGFSMFLANPAFLLLFYEPGRDIIKKRFTWTHGLILSGFLIQLFLLLLHRTFGGFQFGARYTCDLLPYCFLYLLTARKKKTMTVPESMLFAASLCLCFLGAYIVHA